MGRCRERYECLGADDLASRCGAGRRPPGGCQPIPSRQLSDFDFPHREAAPSERLPGARFRSGLLLSAPTIRIVSLPQRYGILSVDEHRRAAGHPYSPIAVFCCETLLNIEAFLRSMVCQCFPMMTIFNKRSSNSDVVDA